MSSSESPTIATTELKKINEPKPIKLRSACNCCFAAKVRCDGKKEGCKRCSEKHLECTYSESMVGKVVGKRRKRPLPDSRMSMSDCKPNPWNVAVGPTAMPSPASTYVSDHSNKRNCMSSEWTSLISYDEQSPLDFSGYDEQFINLDLCQGPTSTTGNDNSFTLNAGLPTPSMSPPEMQFLSPSDLEAASQSTSSGSKHSNGFAPAQYAVPSLSRRQQSYQLEDEETVCIKLLAHLKRFSSRPQQSLQATTSLICKTNATIKRLLQSRTIRTEYTCQLLLTNIAMHLASICEQLLTIQPSQPKGFSEREFINECYLAESDPDMCPESGGQEAPAREASTSNKHTVQESALLCSSIGNLLKRKPLNGFQVLGRHESALIEIELRLRRVIAALS